MKEQFIGLYLLHNIFHELYEWHILDISLQDPWNSTVLSKVAENVK